MTLIDEAKKMLEGISPYPWEHKEMGQADYVYLDKDSYIPFGFGYCSGNQQYPNNAKFIAKSPELISKLISSLEQSEKEKEKLKVVLKDILKLTEEYEVQIDSEWGSCRTLEELEGDLPREIRLARKALLTSANKN